MVHLLQREGIDELHEPGVSPTIVAETLEELRSTTDRRFRARVEDVTDDEDYLLRPPSPSHSDSSASDSDGRE